MRTALQCPNPAKTSTHACSHADVRDNILIRLLAALTLLLPISSLAMAGNKHDLLVTADWLKVHLQQPNLVIVDTRDRDSFDVLHIKNAVNVPVTETFADTRVGSRLAPISTIQSLLGNAGISNRSHLVLYDDNNMLDAARAFWVLEVYGHASVSILNGGFKNWQASDLPMTSDSPSRKPTTYLPTVIPEKLSTKFSTRLAVDDHSKIILDARNEKEYNGKILRFRRAGHIPNAINFPSTLNLTIAANGSKQVKSIPELKKLYAKLDKRKKVITYCNKGKESALTYLVLRQLGYSVSAYDGSWFEWNSDLNLPVETGKGRSWN